MPPLSSPMNARKQRYMYMSCVCLHPTREKQKEQRNVWDSRRCTVELSARVSLHEGSSSSLSAVSVPMDIREASMRGSDAYGCDNTHKTKLIHPQYTMWYVKVMMWILLILGDPDSKTQNHGVISGSCPVSSCIEPQQDYTSKQCYGLRAVSAVD